MSIESLESRHLLAADFVSEFALERGDINEDGELSPLDLDALSQGIDGEYQSALDANRDGALDASDRSFWIESLARTYVGDSNFDGQFGPEDIVAVFIAGQYEDGNDGDETWATGDWNGDGDFTAEDFVAAFQGGGYGIGPRAMIRPSVTFLNQAEQPIASDGGFLTQLATINVRVEAEPFSVVSLKLGNLDAQVGTDIEGVAEFESVALPLGLSTVDVTSHDIWGTAAADMTAIVRGTDNVSGVTPWGASTKRLLDQYLTSTGLTAFLPVGTTPAEALGDQPALERTKPSERPLVAQDIDATIIQDEAEPSDATGFNDDLSTAEPIPNFGTGPGDDPSATVSGTLLPLPVFVDSEEDDGSIGSANDAMISTGETMVANARIGDGPHGSVGTGKGDFDLYAVTGVTTGQTIRIDINTPSDSPLDAFIFVYNSAGDRLDFSDDDGASSDPLLDFVVPADDDYFVSVSSFGTFGPVNPFDSASGVGATTEGEYQVVISIDVDPDQDVYSFELEAGDILGAAVSTGGSHLTFYDDTGNELIGSGQNLSFIHATNSPLPSEGLATAAWVADRSGTYYVAVDGGAGDYELDLLVSRPVLEQEPRGTRQVLFLDFDGATIEPAELFGRGRTEAVLSPMRDFLPAWGLSPNDEAAVIDAIRTVAEENFRDLGAVGSNGDYQADGIDGNFDLEIVTSRDFVDARGFPVDPFGDANVSRMVIGGTIQQLGIRVLGIAEAIDVGNFNTAETAVVLLDLLSGAPETPNSLNGFQRADGVSMIDLIGTAVGNLVAHEAGHFFGSWHTNRSNTVNQLMDQGGNLAALVGVGPDGIFGTLDDVDVDFQVDTFAPNEGYTGFQNSIDAIAFGMSTGTVDVGMVVAETVPGDDRQVTTPPDAFVVRFFDPISASTELDVNDFAVNGTLPDLVAQSGPSEVTLQYNNSPVINQGLQQIEVQAGAVLRASDLAPVNAYAGFFGYDQQPTSVTNVSPPGGEVQLPFGSVRVTFNEPVAADTVSTNDLELSNGFVSSAILVDPQTVEYMIDGIVTEGALAVRLPDGAVTDQFGNFSSGFVTEFVTEIGRVPFVSPLEAKTTLGSLIYDPTMSGQISTAGDVDEFAILVDAGQSISVALTTDTVLQAQVELLRDGRILTTAQANAAGETVLILNDPATGRLIDGNESEFSIRVSSLNDTTGQYTVQVLLNAAYEAEVSTAVPNNDAANAQSLDSAFRSLRGNSPDIASAMGQLIGPIIARDDFESGVLNPDVWTTNSTGEDGRIRITGDFSTSEGSFAMVMDTGELFSPSINEAIWSVDVSGQSQPILVFDHLRFYDEVHPFAGSFVGSFPADGVAISSDGTNWYPIFDAPSTTSGLWQRFEIDLAHEAELAGIALGELQIKFQQFDDNPVAADGRGWDNIRIETPDDADWYQVNLSRGDVATFLATAQNAGDVQIDVFDADGNQIANGLPKASVVANPSFEAGTLTGWTSVTNGATDEPWAIAGRNGRGEIFIDPTDPQDGEFVAWNGLNATEDDTTIVLYQDISLPDDVESAQLSWQHRIQWLFFENDALGKGFELQIRDPDTNAVTDVPFSFSTPPGNDSRNDSTGWVNPSIDLSAYLGEQIRLAFVTTIPEAETGVGQVELDDIELDLGLMTYDNVTDVIRNFEANSNGDYFVRVAGTHATDYSLTVTRNLGFDLESNDDRATAEPVMSPSEGGRQWQIGHVQIGTDTSDFYEISSDGGPLQIETFTPAGGDGEFENLFDPLIRLYDADGNLVAEDDNSADGRNASLRYQVPRDASGTYYVEVTSVRAVDEPGFAGEYVLSVRGNDLALAAIAASVEAEADVAAPDEGLETALVDAVHGSASDFDEL